MDLSTKRQKGNERFNEINKTEDGAKNSLVVLSVRYKHVFFHGHYCPKGWSVMSPVGMLGQSSPTRTLLGQIPLTHTQETTGCTVSLPHHIL